MVLRFEIAKKSQQAPQERFEEAMNQLTELLGDLPKLKRTAIAIYIAEAIQAVRDGAK